MLSCGDVGEHFLRGKRAKRHQPVDGRGYAVKSFALAIRSNTREGLCRVTKSIEILHTHPISHGEE